ncbi:hypothetical protein HNR65_000149 [Desulfosalsimonas propionicica]|uniref:Uncharacterized protein n=1 Tax=Desulfosalsimonas propionicica TaxID=332175 RepID=A0A7W0HJ57_9BACT|nr:hypothetical protein [Desulfosalsimonas propionicica]
MVPAADASLRQKLLAGPTCNVSYRALPAHGLTEKPSEEAQQRNQLLI